MEQEIILIPSASQEPSLKNQLLRGVCNDYLAQSRRTYSRDRANLGMSGPGAGASKLTAKDL